MSMYFELFHLNCSVKMKHILWEPGVYREKSFVFITNLCWNSFPHLWNSPVNFNFHGYWFMFFNNSTWEPLQINNVLNLINFEFYYLFTHNAFSTIARQWLGKTVIVYRMYIIRICVIVFLFQIKYFTKLYFVFISPYESPGELVLLTVLLILFLTPLSIKL